MKNRVDAVRRLSKVIELLGSPEAAELIAKATGEPRSAVYDITDRLNDLKDAIPGTKPGANYTEIEADYSTLEWRTGDDIPVDELQSSVHETCVYDRTDEIVDCSTAPEGQRTNLARTIAELPTVIEAARQLVHEPTARAASTLLRAVPDRDVPPGPYSEDNAVIFDSLDRAVADVSKADQPGFVGTVLLEMPAFLQAARMIADSATAGERGLDLDREALGRLKESLSTLDTLKVIAEDRAGAKKG